MTTLYLLEEKKIDSFNNNNNNGNALLTLEHIWEENYITQENVEPAAAGGGINIP